MKSVHMLDFFFNSYNLDPDQVKTILLSENNRC